MPQTGNPLIIVGGGGAGMLAAWRAATLGARVMLLERNQKFGVKLLISGGGKCNITHSGPMESLRKAFAPREGRFLRHAFHAFTNDHIVTLLQSREVQTFARENGRIFPVSGRARDVVEALLSALAALNVNLQPGIRVDSIESAEGAITGVRTARETIPSGIVVLATGGVSYPKTGTTGDGHRWTAGLGHTIVPLRAALAPIRVRPPLPASWRGVAVRDGCLAVHARRKKIAEWKGDLLFTHEGLSGPAALEVSRAAAKAAEEDTVSLSFDFFPGIDFPSLDDRLLLLVQNNRAKTIASVLEPLLPNRIIAALMQSIPLDPSTRCHVLTREQRRGVVRVLKTWEIGEVAAIPIDRGEVTAGGIDLGEIDPQTMSSRKVRGLYACGEMLDVAGPIGGYNLQAAFSTGYVAGDAAARDWLSRADATGIFTRNGML